VTITDPKNLSNWYRCPNSKACPGGIVAAAVRAGLGPRILQPMCLQGFTGQG
ncbi:unnamed protein product, partial [Symbiodinium necroappetens]